ncbi:MAG: hypothetical protein HY898_18245 [Deltaproteobacteria bacterium]|nr:hypothetical protein [Deltaproteobacteria bacterium]
MSVRCPAPLLPAMLSLLAGIAACAHGKDLGPEQPANVTDERPKIDRGPTSTDSDIGGLSQEDVEDQFKTLHPRFLDCVQRTSSRINYVGGRVALRMRITKQGEVRWAYLTESTLGDRDAERCVLDVVRHQTWPRPLSGEGLAESSFEVDPSEAPITWPQYKTAALADRAMGVTRRCRKGIGGTFQATAYVGPKGDVIAAGVAPPNSKGEEVADCFAEALRAIQVGNLTVGQRKAAKVSFAIR